MQFPKKLQQKITQRVAQNSLRKLDKENSLIDFSSNDYLGFAKSEVIFNKTHQFLVDNNSKVNGATGSRLLSGNHKLYTEVEKQLEKLHNSETALVFNSGYDANIGFFASVPQRGDIILYDEFIHASIRDGIQLSNAKSFKFKHNDLVHLNELLKKFQQNDSEVYVVTESVFSMDGDSPDLVTISQITNKHTNVHLVVDEAHALGVFNFGLIQKLQLENDIFARIVTFGKGLGCHGAAILGSEQLQQYLINFARSFIYTTGLSPHALATIKIAYDELSISNSKEQLQQNIQHFISESNRLQLSFIESSSAIHCCIISGNERVKNIALQLQKSGFEVKPILSPTIPLNQERLRFCLHAYNSKEEITDVLEKLATFV
ncbi:aminotransferase class I/II-fold pyridoxal phosphate-dependent enzyme [Tenacibaculum larymnensis]|uniref:Pyridoxal phosphate-dependent aminotransferase family protein n=1 Tax=Tenacibaculum larymnensis TaxID=2878201 RepID=A0A9X4IQH7_9FLAO|nr:pyridoxal phosphate-dependent aminotransferase family protein [Tenacibaculum larymnensis]MDE1207850.1 pyridoxal phosphate-dependent aminotransferase family protein [Tenacibaculum larymnensis]